MTAIATPIGNRIVSLRQQRGWSQKELAAFAKVPRPWLSLVETGEIETPGADRLDLVAAAFGVDSRYLISGEGRDDTVSLPIPRSAVGDTSEFAPWPDDVRHVALAAGRAMLRAWRSRLPIEHAIEQPQEPGGRDGTGQERNEQPQV